MNWKKWKTPILGWACVALVVWALLYAIYWHDRTGHVLHWGDALVNWLGDVVMLQWVKSYQTLVAGLLAALAGAFVYLTAIYQRRAAIADRRHQIRIQRVERNEARRDSLISVLAGIKAEIQQLYNWVMTENKPSLRRSVEAIERSLPQLAMHSPFLVNYFSLVTREINEELGIWNSPTAIDPDAPIIPFENAMRAMAHVIVAKCYLDDLERLVSRDGRFVHSRVKPDPGYIDLIKTDVIHITAVSWSESMLNLEDFPRPDLQE